MVKQNQDQEASFRQIDRLVNFSDAVIAIAVTLLILPLVDKASDLQITSFGGFMDGVGQQLFVFLLSFAVICRFWLVHHNLLHSLQKFSPLIFWLNSLWLLSIVLIPFPTELIGRWMGEGSFVPALYIANLLATSLTSLAIQYAVRRSPHLQRPETVRSSMAQGAVSAVILLVSLTVSLFVSPSLGLWSLFLLFLTGVFTDAVSRINLLRAQ